MFQPRRAGTGPRRSHQPPRPVCARGLRSARSLPAAATAVPRVHAGAGPAQTPGTVGGWCATLAPILRPPPPPGGSAGSPALANPDHSIPHLSPGLDPWASRGPGAAQLGRGGGEILVAKRETRSHPGCRPSPLGAQSRSLEEESKGRASPILARPGMRSRDNGSPLEGASSSHLPGASPFSDPFPD